MKYSKAKRETVKTVIQIQYVKLQPNFQKTLLQYFR